MNISSSSDNDDTKVVLEQTLLRTEEVFVYRIPPMMTSGGHHADDWDLANPIATCSLHVLRRDSTLFLKLLIDKPKPNGPPGATEKHLFAESKITINATSTNISSNHNATTAIPSSSSSSLSMSHWIEPVTDSSRYFVIRISDEQRKKEAHIGIGFRERNDALNLKMSLQEYENTMRKEAMVNDMDDGNNAVNDEQYRDDHGEHNSISNANEMISNLSLKDGEKIHINLKNISSSRNRIKKSTSSEGSTSSSVSKPFLLKKPPPPASSSAADTDDDKGVVQNSTSSIQNVSIALQSPNNEGDDNDDDDDDWGDFESSSTDNQ